MNDNQIVRCPFCQNAIQVAAQIVGQVVSCPYCQQTIQVAATTDQPLPAPLAMPNTSQNTANANLRSGGRPNSNRGFYTIIGISIASVSVLLLLGAGLFSWYMMSTNHPRRTRDVRELRGAELDEFYEQQELERVLSGEDESAYDPTSGGLNPKNAK